MGEHDSTKTFRDWLQSMDGADGAGDEAVIAEVERRVIAEREACAKTADDIASREAVRYGSLRRGSSDYTVARSAWKTSKEIAAAIRGSK